MIRLVLISVFTLFGLSASCLSVMRSRNEWEVLYVLNFSIIIVSMFFMSWKSYFDALWLSE